MIALIFSTACREIFSMCFPEDLHFYMKNKRIFDQKCAFFLMHFFGLIFIEALKMVENPEKQLFTFFAFVPLYFGVSGSLVSLNG